MLFLLWLFIVCFSQVGFAASEDALVDAGSVTGDDMKVRQRSGSVLKSDNAKAYSADLDVEHPCQRTFRKGAVFTTEVFAVCVLGYCAWVDPRMLIAPLLGVAATVAATGFVAAVNWIGASS